LEIDRVINSLIFCTENRNFQNENLTVIISEVQTKLYHI